MKNIGISQSRKISLLAFIACATMLASCGGGGGGGEYEGGDANGGETNAGGVSTISAAPALLSRSCDGQQSPQLFCPTANGG